jgi:hypothetical protein
MAFWALLSFVDATIFIVLVIFSMFRIDLRRPSISRRVANVAALGTMGLIQRVSRDREDGRLRVQRSQKAMEWYDVMTEVGTYRIEEAGPTLRAGRAALESTAEDM